METPKDAPRAAKGATAAPAAPPAPPAPVAPFDTPLGTLAGGDCFWHPGSDPAELYVKCLAGSPAGRTTPAGKCLCCRLSDGRPAEWPDGDLVCPDATCKCESTKAAEVAKAEKAEPTKAAHATAEHAKGK